MADKKISALTASTTPLAGTEVLPIVQSGVTKQVSVANLTAGRAVEVGQLFSGIAYNAARRVNTQAAAGETAAFIGGVNGYALIDNVDSGHSYLAQTVDLTVQDMVGNPVSIFDVATKNVNTYGNLAIKTSGKGIDFSVTGDPAGMTSELLADYEEGTWTPTISSATGSITSYTVNSARYTKVGRIVTLTLQFAVTNNGTGAGGLVVAGFPYTNAVATCGSTYNQSTGAAGTISVNTGATSGNIYKYDGTYPVATGQTIQCSITYQV